VSGGRAGNGPDRPPVPKSAVCGTGNEAPCPAAQLLACIYPKTLP